MLVQADTNILLRSVETDHPLHAVVAKAVEALNARGDTLVVFPQNLREFWNVCTRPRERNGLGMSHEQAEASMQDMEATFLLLEDGLAVYREWRRMVYIHRVSGAQVHDCYIAAAMRVHEITHLLTFNPGDFARYGITILDPTAV